MELKFNKKKLIVIIIFLFSIISIWVVMTQRPNQNLIKQAAEQNVNASAGSDLLGATNIRSFSDIYSNNNSNKTKNTSQKRNISVRPKPTPIPPPYPRININYTFQKIDSIRGITAGSNNSFIQVSLDIRNYGYKYFDADPSKFRLDPGIEPILNISTGNMINAVLPNNSQALGDLIFLVNNKQRWSNRLQYVDGYTIIYHYGIQSGGSGIQSGGSGRKEINVVYPISQD